MLISRLLHIVFCLVVSLSLVAADRNADGMSLPFASVGDMIIVEAVADGVRGHYVFDTGAKEVILHSFVIDIDRSVEMITADGIVYAEPVDINSFSLGAHEVLGLSGLRMDLSFLSDELGVPIAGILGWSALAADEITIDYESSVLRLSAPQVHLEDELHDVVRLDMTTMMGDLPMVQVAVRDSLLSFAFDTGAPISVIDKERIHRRLDINDIYIEDIMLTDYLRVEQNLLRVEDLSSFYDHTNNKRMDGVLSVSSLSAKIVFLDRKSSRVYLFWKKGQLDRRMAIAD